MAFTLFSCFWRKIIESTTINWVKNYIYSTLLDIDKLFSYKAFTIHTPSKEIY